MAIFYQRVRMGKKLGYLGSDRLWDAVIVQKVQVGKDQEKAQSEKDSHSKNRGGEKNKLTIRYLYHENIS